MDATNQHILFPVEPEEIYKKVTEIIRLELRKANEAQQYLYHTPGLNEKPLYTIDEVCEMFNVTRQTLNSWRKEGLIIHSKIKSRVYYRKEEIEKLLNNRK